MCVAEVLKHHDESSTSSTNGLPLLDGYLNKQERRRGGDKATYCADYQRKFPIVPWGSHFNCPASQTKGAGKSIEEMLGAKRSQ